MENRNIYGWNMLDSYSEGQAIYGRDHEISSINDSIQYNIQTFLYGKSGIGKTSLIQAGLFPELRKANFFPVVIRLSFYKGEPLRDVVKRLIQEEAIKENVEVNKVKLKYSTIDGSDVSKSPLYEYFAKMSFTDYEGTPYVPVLIFDQFEETINNEENWQSTVDFLKDDLYDLMDSSFVIVGNCHEYTNYRIVFSMREDYLYCLEDIIDKYSLWELRYNRFRVKALNDENAAKVIKLTSGKSGLESGNEDIIVDTIIKIVKINSGTRFTEINTALLSLICSLLSMNSTDGCIRYNDLRMINSYLKSYYDNICDHIGERATRYLEKQLLTKDGRRSSIDETEALNSNKITKKQLDYLIEKHLLRRIKIDSTSTRYEYIHDLFAKMVYKKKISFNKTFFLPDYKSISGRINRHSFAKCFFINLLICSIISINLFAYHSYFFHHNLNIIKVVKEGYLCQIIYMCFLGTSFSLLPLFIKRLHDTGHSGLILMTVPISIFFINIQHFSPVFNNCSWIINLIGIVVLLSLFLNFFFKPSSNSKTRYKISSKFEAFYNGTITNNKDFIKFITAEFVFLIICCWFVDLFYYTCWNTNHIEWKPIKLPLYYLSIFNSNIVVPSAVSIFPLALCFSPALNARIRSFGYSYWLAFIPYFNVILLLEGLLPNSFLQRMKLLRINNVNVKNENSIYIDLITDLSPVIYTKAKSSMYSSHSILTMVLIPFYALLKLSDQRVKPGERALLLGILYVKNAITLLYLLILVYLDVFQNLPEIIDVLSIIFFIWETAFSIIIFGLLCRESSLLESCIIKVIRSNPNLSINQIADYIAYRPINVEKIINKLLKKGQVEREVINGNIKWIVKEKYGTHNKSQGND